MKKFPLLILLLFIIIVAGIFISNISFVKQYLSTNTNQQPVENLNQLYTAKLPCADCSGIAAVLILMPDNQYQEQDTYLGKNVSFTEKGTWMEKRGTPKNSSAIILVLTPSNGQQRNYQMNGNKLIALDQYLQPISSPFDLSFTKQ